MSGGGERRARRHVGGDAADLPANRRRRWGVASGGRGGRGAARARCETAEKRTDVELLGHGLGQVHLEEVGGGDGDVHGGQVDGCEAPDGEVGAGGTSWHAGLEVVACAGGREAGARGVRRCQAPMVEADGRKGAANERPARNPAGCAPGARAAGARRHAAGGSVLNTQPAPTARGRRRRGRVVEARGRLTAHGRWGLSHTAALPGRGRGAATAGRQLIKAMTSGRTLRGRRTELLRRQAAPTLTPCEPRRHGAGSAKCSGKGRRPPGNALAAGCASFQR